MSVHMVWIESMMTRRGVVPSRERRDDVLDRGLGRELDRRAGEAEPFGAQPHLRHRLFARDVDRALARLRASAAATWISKVDLPMPGSPPSSSTDPRTNPPPVTRSNSAMPEASLGASCVAPASGSSANLRPLRGARPGMAGDRVAAASSGDRVPFAAGVALALPAAVDGAAVLADEARIASGHGFLAVC